MDATDRPIEITAEYRKHFVRMYLEHITYTFVQPQLKAFDAGFYSVIERSSLKMLSPQNLREILEGSTHLDIDELRRSTEYGHPYTGSKPYIRAFWKLVSSWPEEKQMKLVKFVTAAERIPAAGVGKLNFKIHPARGVQSRDLPSSSTCFGTLNLPYYENSEVMNDKLTQALELGVEGFGVA